MGFEKVEQIHSAFPAARANTALLVPAGNDSHLEAMRSRWTAHLEAEYDSTTKSYRIVDLASLRQVHLTGQKVMPVITESVSHLAGLLKGLDINSKQWEEIAKREALDFWQISDPSPDLIGDLGTSTKVDVAQDEILSEAPTRSETSREVAAELRVR